MKSLSLFKPYQLRVLSSWFVNLSAGSFVSIFVLFNNSFLLFSAVLLSILALLVAFLLEDVAQSL